MSSSPTPKSRGDDIAATPSPRSYHEEEVYKRTRFFFMLAFRPRRDPDLVLDDFAGGDWHDPSTFTVDGSVAMFVGAQRNVFVLRSSALGRRVVADVRDARRQAPFPSPVLGELVGPWPDRGSRRERADSGMSESAARTMGWREQYHPRHCQCGNGCHKPGCWRCRLLYGSTKSMSPCPHGPFGAPGMMGG